MKVICTIDCSTYGNVFDDLLQILYMIWLEIVRRHAEGNLQTIWLNTLVAFQFLHVSYRWFDGDGEASISAKYSRADVKQKKIFYHCYIPISSRNWFQRRTKIHNALWIPCIRKKYLYHFYEINSFLPIRQMSFWRKLGSV